MCTPKYAYNKYRHIWVVSVELNKDLRIFFYPFIATNELEVSKTMRYIAILKKKVDPIPNKVVLL